ncbi:unnamed protein product [Lupinus luteus]|uniref:Late nodulin domain-containing protein n=1 Tax=Lupinus luteus TaxID=3873 RepID=A0AAV1YM82_LUPLU
MAKPKTLNVLHVMFFLFLFLISTTGYGTGVENKVECATDAGCKDRCQKFLFIFYECIESKCYCYNV